MANGAGATNACATIRFCATQWRKASAETGLPASLARPSHDRRHCPGSWRPRRESNPRTRICSPLRNHSATRPSGRAAPKRCAAIATERSKPQGMSCRIGDAPGDRAACHSRACARGSELHGISHPSGFIPALSARGLASTPRRLYARIPLIPDSSAVEQPAVNRLVAGSNPAPGANEIKGLGL